MQTISLLIVVFLCMTSHVAADCFAEFVDIYNKYGREQYMFEEEITQQNHVLQAAYLSYFAGAPEEVTIGLLFHDIGRMVEPENIFEIELQDKNHDDLGSMWMIDHGFPEMVANLVKYHTLAKVVLCRDNPEYYDHLSATSKKSYHIQKVKHEQDPASMAAFESLPYSDMIIRARKCDDMAKIVGVEADQGHIPHFSFYREMVGRVLAGRGLPARKDDWQNRIDDLHAEMCRNRQKFENRMRNVLSTAFSISDTQ